MKVTYLIHHVIIQVCSRKGTVKILFSNTILITRIKKPFLGFNFEFEYDYCILFDYRFATGLQNIG